jgi:hypothetical protein
LQWYEYGACRAPTLFPRFFWETFRGQVHIPERGIFPAIMGADIDRIAVTSPSLGFHPMAPLGGKESTQRCH